MDTSRIPGNISRKQDNEHSHERCVHKLKTGIHFQEVVLVATRASSR